MAKKKQDEELVAEVSEQVEVAEDVKEKKPAEKKLTLLEFIEKHNITGFLRRAYVRKFSPGDKFSEAEWLKK